MNEKNLLENFTTKNDRLNEFPGKEIGIDYLLPSHIEISSLAQNIFNVFEGNDIYKIAKTMPSIIKSRIKYYSYWNKEGVGGSKLFTISIREKDGVISIKRKGDKVEKKGVIFRDEFETQLPFKQWTPEVEEKVKLEQSKLFNISPTQINQNSENTKRKLKIRIENSNTKRVYTIGIMTKIKKNEQPRYSLSIDYIGREIKKVTEDEILVENAIIEDIKKIKEKVLKVMKI